MLLNSTNAAAAEASGSEPYGSLASTIFNAGTSFLTEPAELGSPQINSVLIRPITGGQSNIPGTFIVAEDEMNILSLNLFGFEYINISVAETRVENMDSFGYPLEFLKTEPKAPNVVHNKITVGVGEKSFES